MVREFPASINVRLTEIMVNKTVQGLVHNYGGLLGPFNPPPHSQSPATCEHDRVQAHFDWQ